MRDYFLIPLQLRKEILHRSSMVHLVLIIALVGWSSLLLHAGEGVWTSIGPEGGRVFQLWVHPTNPNIIFATTGVGLYTSSDGGSHWGIVTNGLERKSISFFAADPADFNHLLVGSDACYQSVDGGTTWSLAGQNMSFSAVAFSPTNRNMVYAISSSDQNFYKSLDGGSTWVSNNDSTLGYPNVIAIDSTDSNTLYLGNNQGVFTSTDAGTHWTKCGNSGIVGTASAILIDPSSHQTLYVGGSSGIIKSTDKGDTWISISQGIGNSMIWRMAIDPSHSNILYAGGYNGLFKTTDGGEKWNVIPIEGLKASSLAVAASAPNTLFVGDDNAKGIFKSVDGGNSWNAVNTGFVATNVQALAQNPFDPKVLLAFVRGEGLFKTVDGGKHWIRWGTLSLDSSILYSYRFRWDSANRDVLYVFGYGLVSKSIDGGLTWKTILDAGAFSGLAIDPRNPNNLIVAAGDPYNQYCCRNGIYKSEDGGQTWQESNNGVPDQDLQGRKISTLSMDPQNPDVLYFINSNGALYGSEDMGLTWKQISQKFDFYQRPVNLFVDPNNSSTIYVYAVFEYIYKSMDKGRHFRSFAINGSAGASFPILALDPLNPDILYAGTDIRGVYRSSDGGSLWVPINTGLANAGITSLFFDADDSSTLLAATSGGGVYSLTLKQEPASLLSIVSPVEGERLEVGSARMIEWNSTGDISEVKLEISLDDGVTFSTLVSALPNKGSYWWIIPNTPSTQVKIRISDVEGKAAAASAGSFSIALPAVATTIKIDSPSPGAIVSGTVTLNGSVSGSSNVGMIYFYVDTYNWVGGTQAAADGTFSFQWDTAKVYSGAHKLLIEANSSDALVLAMTQFQITVADSKPDWPITWVLPSSARAAGVGGAFYTTDLTIANTGILDASFTLKFLGHDVDGTNGPEKTMTIGAGKSLAYADVLQSVFGLESGYGAIYVTSNNSDLILTGQTSTPGGGGTYGQSVPGMLTGMREEFLNTICGIREDQAFRSNLIMANLSTVERKVDIGLIDEMGLVLAAKSYKIPPMGMTQVNRIVRDLGVASNISSARLFLSSKFQYGYGAFAAYVSLIDNITNDPRTLLSQIDYSASSDSWILPSSARAAGVNGAFYTTDLSIANIGVTDARCVLRFLGHDVDGRSAPKFPFELTPGTSLKLTDVLQSAFGLQSGYGAIRLSTTDPDLAISSQTSTPSGDGTFGQSVPAYTALDLIDENLPRSICAIREDDSFRTNLVLTNAVEQPVVVDVKLSSGDGALLGTRQVTLPPWGMTQLSRVVRQLGVSSDLSNARLQLSTTTAGASFAAYASVIDNVTNDPRTLLPR